MSPAESDVRTPAPTRTRPRLSKARKHLHRKSHRAEPQVEVPGKGSSSNSVSCSGFVFGEGSKRDGLGDGGASRFVFGSGGGTVRDGVWGRTGVVEMNEGFDGREDRARVEVSGGSDAAFVFGSGWLDTKMGNLNISDKAKKSSLKDDDEDNVFVFGKTGNQGIGGVSSGSESFVFKADGGSSAGGEIKGCVAASSEQSVDQGFSETCDARRPVNVDRIETEKKDDDEDNVFVFGKTGNLGIGSVSSGSESFVFKADGGSSAGGEIKGGVAASSEQSVDQGFSATCDGRRPANVDSIETESYERKSPDGSRASSTEFQPPQWDPSCLKESLFAELHKTPNFDIKRKLRRKLKPPSLYKQKKAEDHLQNASSINSPGYAPMDFSPYRDTTTDERKDGPLTRNVNGLDRVDTQPATPPTVSASLKNMGGLTHGKESSNSGEPMEEISGNCSERRCEGSDSSNELGTCKKKVGNAAAGKNAVSERMDHSQMFCFTSGLLDADTGKCSSSSSLTPKIPSTRRFRRKKYRKHALSEPFVIASSSNSQEQGGNFGEVETGNVSEFSEQVHMVDTPPADELQEACETWRLRGNRVFKNGDVSKAEEFYSRGIDTAASCEVSGYCLKPLVICYSNRAAARMSLGNMRGAISDCAKAAILDPSFLKVQLRAANCHLLLGEVENALSYYNKCLESPAGVCLDRRITVEAADSLQKAQKVADCITSAAKLLEQKTPDAALRGLDITDEALSISPLSERLLEIKSWFLFLLCKYDEVIQLCECTLDAADKNFVSVGSDEHFVNLSDPKSERYSIARLWRRHLISKSYFYTGRLQKALDLLEKLQELKPLSLFSKELKNELESTAALAVTIHDLLNHKNAGNLAVQSGRYAEAVEHYTVALSSNLQSRPFAAICFCNRAAGYQALGQIVEAIADCSLAIALNKNYTKALARRATLHEMIRDYGQAAVDLRRVISIIENQSDRKDGKTGTDGQSPSTKELRQAERRLRPLEEEAKNGISLDFYLILGVKESDLASDVKKAYRKAALRHHPDKACQYLARSGGGHEGQIWKEILQEVHADADRLFKIIGEANSVLSDPSKRQQYDLDEEIRKMKKQKGTSSPWNRTSESHGFPSERRNQRQNSQDNWKTYGHGPYYRW